jgi:hypothetical protein
MDFEWLRTILRPSVLVSVAIALEASWFSVGRPEVGRVAGVDIFCSSAGGGSAEDTPIFEKESSGVNGEVTLLEFESAGRHLSFCEIVSRILASPVSEV